MSEIVIQSGNVPISFGSMLIPFPNAIALAAPGAVPGAVDSIAATAYLFGSQNKTKFPHSSGLFLLMRPALRYHARTL